MGNVHQRVFNIDNKSDLTTIVDYCFIFSFLRILFINNNSIMLFRLK